MTNDNRPATTLGNYLCRNALGSKRFDDVAHLYIAVVGDGNTALHAVADFAGIIFEAAQRAHFAGEDHDIVTQQADFGVALDDAVCDLASGDRADFRNAEGLAHLRPALVSFLDSRLEETAHSALDLVLQLVNDRVQADVYLFLLRQFLRFAFRTHVEANDDGIRRRGQQHVRLSNRAHAGVQHFEADFIVREFGEQVAEYFDRAPNVSLENNIQFLHAGSRQLFGESFQRYAGTLGQLGFARLLFAVLGNSTSFVAIRNHDELVTRLRQSFHAQYFHRSGRRGFLQLRAAIVKHGTYFSINIAHNEIVAGAQRSVLREYSSDGSAAAIELGLKHHAGCRTVGRRFQFLQIGHQADHFHEQVQVGLFLG